jgi:hypothetical protein
MSDFQRLLFLIVLDSVWCIHCALWAHLFRQPYRSTVIATVGGILIVGWMLR